MGFFSKGLKNEFETAVVNELSVFQPLKFYCNLHNDDVRGDRRFTAAKRHNTGYREDKISFE